LSDLLENIVKYRVSYIFKIIFDTEKIIFLEKLSKNY
jgi:hypothetical protein